MNLAFRLTMLFAAHALVFFAWGGLAVAQTQAPPQTKGLLSEQAFKNINSLKGIPVDEFMSTMGFFSASLAENCLYCHVLESAGDWSKFAEDNDHKVTARRMIAMVGAINKNFFNGRREITCYSCHRGGQKPKVTPSIADLYGPVPPDDTPDAMTPIAAPRGAKPEAILDHYIEAIGAQSRSDLRASRSKAFIRASADERVPFDQYGKAAQPARAESAHGGLGDTTTTFDGTMGWIAGPARERPVQVIELTGGDLDGAKFDGVHSSFPHESNKDLQQLRTLLPTTIDDKDVLIVARHHERPSYPIDLYFDEKTHLLLRSLRFSDSPVGLTPTQVDYSDYRDVNGVKIPFKRTIYWLDGRVILEASDVQLNGNVDPKRFDKPVAPPAKSPGK